MVAVAEPPPPLTLRDRKLLVQRVQELGATEHGEIFKMLQANGVDHMRNSNGIFVNLTNVPDSVLRQVQTFVTFCIENNSSLDEYDKQLNERKFLQQQQQLQQQWEPGRAAQAPQLTRAADEIAVAAAPAPASCSHAAAAAVPTVPPPVVGSQGAKYAQARKRFAKRRVAEKEKAPADGGEGGLLTPEQFPIERT